MVLDEYELRRWPGLVLSDTILRDRGTDALGRRALESLTKGPGGGFRDDLGLAIPDERKAGQRALDSIPSATTGRPPVDEDEVEQTARVYLEAGPKAVKRMLGHASAAMTLDVYPGLFDDELDSLADRLDEVLGASEGPATAPVVPVRDALGA